MTAHVRDEACLRTLSLLLASAAKSPSRWGVLNCPDEAVAAGSDIWAAR